MDEQLKNQLENIAAYHGLNDDSKVIEALKDAYFLGSNIKNDQWLKSERERIHSKDY